MPAQRKGPSDSRVRARRTEDQGGVETACRACRDRKIEEHIHYTRQHGSKVRSEHAFFDEVCDALADIESILVVGSHMAQADFRHDVEKHRTALGSKIVRWETVGHPTDGEIVKIAREFFVKRGELAATPRMT